MINTIVAMDESRGIGKDGKIPWHYSEDLKYFKNVTLGNILIMGRVTWESIGCKPLKGRKAIVVSSKPEVVKLQPDDTTTIVMHCPEAALNQASSVACSIGREVFIVGGESIYRSLLKYSTKVFVTTIKGNWECDTFFPKLDKYFFEDYTYFNVSTNPSIDFKVYRRKNSC